MKRTVFSPKIKNFLLANNILDEAQIEQAERRAGNAKKYPEEVLVEDKIISPEKFAAVKGEVFSLPVADLSEVKVPQEILNLLTSKVAGNYQMVIFGKEKRQIKVGLVNPEDFQAQDAIDFLAKQQNLEPEFFVISLEDFRKVFDQYGGFKKEIGSALESAKAKFEIKEELMAVKPGGQGEEFDEAVKAAPVAKIVSVIIKHALDGGASDIHIEPGQTEARVRYRVDGLLHTSLSLPRYLHTAVISRIKVLANLKLDETRTPQDGRIRAKIGDQEVDLRVSVLPMLEMEKIVMRVLDTSAGVPTLKELGLSDYHIEIIDRNMKRPHGLFLLTGPTGSGKTSTLYSVLNLLNDESKNITTLEDPIEYYVNGINQSQINPEIGFSFAAGLRSILRQDPNIIMVGEIRDNETVELVIHAGLTGHLVFSTLHTNDAVGAIPRLIDMKAEPFLLSSTLNLIIAQRLVRKICPNCKKEMKLPPRVEENVKEEIKNMPPELLKEFSSSHKFYQGVGCDRCAKTGYIGRTVVAEILEVDMELRDLIAKNFTMEQMRALLKKKNFITLKQDGVVKALRGFTTMEEILRVSQT